jgi:hypothetical protein
MTKNKTLLVLALLFIALPLSTATLAQDGSASAPDKSSLESRVKELQERLDRVEIQNRQLVQLLQELKTRLDAPPQPVNVVNTKPAAVSWPAGSPLSASQSVSAAGSVVGPIAAIERVGPSSLEPAAVSSTGPAAVKTPTAQAAQTKEPAFIPAIAPFRVLPITPPKKDGLIPDIKLGSAVRLQPYGFFKMSAVEMTTSSGGAIFGSNDFPQGPLLLSDTGPDGDPQFHVKDRAMRLGVNFEWPDVAKNLTLTGKLEFDFEGNFTDVNNRNISAIRSSQPSLRLAWIRMDTKLHDVPIFFQFGQDYSIFGSSTLMDLFETTGFGFAQGNLYERMPMFRTGFQLHNGKLKVQPELAIALPVFGEAGLSVDQRLRFGGRVGSEANQPELEGRIVLEFPLSNAKGVVPAEIIFSYDHAVASEILGVSDLPAGPIRAAFQNGLRLNTTRNAWSAEAQLPTPFFTLAGKYYRGGDLRFYFQGQFNDVFQDLAGATPIPGGTAVTFAGRTIQFGTRGGQVVAPALEPVLGQGGFLQLGLPLSRIFGANPEGRQAGWTMYFTYGIDSAFAKDTARLGANGLLRTDHGSSQLRYRFNKWCTFIDEVTYIDTRTVGGIRKLFRGVPAHTTHAWRNEFGPVFTF